MKIIDHKAEGGAVAGKCTATFEATTSEIDGLVKALKTAEQFKHLARKACGFSEKNADWTMYSFRILTHDGRVEVIIRNGMCG